MGFKRTVTEIKSPEGFKSRCQVAEEIISVLQGKRVKMIQRRNRKTPKLIEIVLATWETLSSLSVHAQQDSQREGEREKMAERIIIVIIVETLPNFLLKIIHLNIQRAEKMPSRINLRNPKLDSLYLNCLKTERSDSLHKGVNNVLLYYIHCCYKNVWIKKWT